MSKIKDIIIYPIKSCKGISISESKVLKTGLKFDRKWQLVDDSFNFLSQRQIKELALIATNLREHSLDIEFLPTGEKITISIDTSSLTPILTKVWGDECKAYKYGDDVSHFFTKILSKYYKESNIHLVQFDDKSARPSNTKAPLSNTPFFADGFPFLVISQESLDDLNQRLIETKIPPVSMDRFRPNIVIEGCDPYEEDRNTFIEIDHGIKLKLVSPCTRCTMITIDQDTTQKSQEPLLTLSKYKPNPQGKGIVFGQNAILNSDNVARIHIGMDVKFLKN